MTMMGVKIEATQSGNFVEDPLACTKFKILLHIMCLLDHLGVLKQTMQCELPYTFGASDLQNEENSFGMQECWCFRDYLIHMRACSKGICCLEEVLD